MPRVLLWLLALTLPLYLLDQVTKQWVLDTFSEPPPPWEHPETGEIIVPNGSLDEPITVIEDFFYLHRVHNRGVAWGMFSESAGANWFFGILSVTVLVVVVFLWHRGKLGSTWLSSLAAGLLCAGILGNLTDRLRLGYVVDFLDFHFGSYRYPSFNVADSCICVAAVLLFLTNLREPDASNVDPKDASTSA